MIENKILKLAPVNWMDLEPIQNPNFKEMSKDEYEQLKNSVLKNGIIDALKVWQDKKSKIWLLDGVGRRLLADKLKSEDKTFPKKWDALFINCKDRKEAAKFVLIYSSRYRRILEETLDEFIHVNELDFEDLKTEIDIPEIDLKEFEEGWIKEFNGNIIDENEQGKLDKKQKIICPKCKYEFSK